MNILGGKNCSRITLIAAAALVAALVCWLRALAIPGPMMDLDRLAADSDVIVTGEVVSLQAGPPHEIDEGSPVFHAQSVTGLIRIADTLKGDTTSEEISFVYLLPETYRGWKSVALHQYGVFFLARSQPLHFTSPYFPFVPAAPGVAVSGSNALERVISVLYGTASAIASSDDQKISAIRTLANSKSPQSLVDLRELTGSGPLSSRVAASAGLLRKNDLSGLNVAVDALLHKSLNIPEGVLQDAEAAIALDVTDPDATPSLAELLTSEDIAVRRAAASGLMRTRSASAAKPLFSLLEDPDFETRYYAAVGLAEINRQPEWRPTMEEFRGNEDKYLRHWKAWKPETLRQ